MLRLYHNDMSVCAQKVRLALAEKGLDYEGVHLNLRTGDQKQPEYLKLNPNGVVPTLVHDDAVVIESTIINEYLEDAFRERSLRPSAPVAIARMRYWTKQIDSAIFPATGTMSMSIAFHHQFAPEAVEAIAKTRPPAYRQSFALFQMGVDNPNLPGAVRRMNKMVSDIDSALADSGPWLLGRDYTLADVAYAPYFTRLDQLRFLEGMIEKRPRAAGWYERMQSRDAYRAALTRWFNPKYLPLMEAKGNEAWPRVKEMLAAA